MEFIKKIIQQAVTTGATTGCTRCFVIIPDTGVTYNMKISLTSDSHDFGFFDTYNFSGATGITGITIINQPYLITGISSSMLSTIKKYSVSSYVQNQYFLSNNYLIDGLDLVRSGLAGITGATEFTNYNIVYYVGGIEYTEFSGISGQTCFQMIGQAFSSDNYINKPIVKDENKENMTGKPIINSDVFILRQEFSVFERNYNLEFIKNLAQLETYAGGAYFNIVKNT